MKSLAGVLTALLVISPVTAVASEIPEVFKNHYFLTEGEKAYLEKQPGFDTVARSWLVMPMSIATIKTIMSMGHDVVQSSLVIGYGLCRDIKKHGGVSQAYNAVGSKDIRFSRMDYADAYRYLCPNINNARK